ncbi:MAG: hypothetical protein Q8P41_26810 [Pseudomonadota bacterium]|nr:hypothetical protein [Pseudomonadota bacterium]
MLYDGWATKIAARFQRRFDEIEVNHNFDFGSEFEIAVCEVLRTILPQRASVCRGYVVGQDGSKAGDDIVIFDSAKFPTLRSLGRSLALREEVPAEAVLAYIEAKHTLNVDGTGPQSLAKAIRQVGGVKAIHREQTWAGYKNFPLPPRSTSSTPSYWPDSRNPWYTAIWARHVSVPSKRKLPVHESLLVRATGLEPGHERCPDVIAGESSILFPVFRQRDQAGAPGGPTACSFRTAPTELAAFPATAPLGLAALHLLWAIESIDLGAIPWDRMLTEQLDPATMAVRPRA